jgi:hypothetical protein
MYIFHSFKSPFWFNEGLASDIVWPLFSLNRRRSRSHGMAARAKRLYRYLTLLAKLFGSARELKMSLHYLLPFFLNAFSHNRFSLFGNLIV